MKRYQKEITRSDGNPGQPLGPVEQTSEYLYQRGATIAALGTNPTEVIRLYERAVDTDDPHPGALFGLGLENDRRGNDEVAINLYGQAAGCFPAHVGSTAKPGRSLRR